MIKVVIESPYAGEALANLDYLERCMLDCLRRGEAPFASHGIYLSVLDDNVPTERKLGIEAGFAWGNVADKIVVYTDRGYSSGMIAAIEYYSSLGKPIEYRSLVNES